MKGAVAQREVEKVNDDEEYGAMIPKPPNLVGRENNECCSATGGLRQAKAGISLVIKAFSSFRKQEVLGTVQVAYNPIC